MLVTLPIVGEHVLVCTVRGCELGVVLCRMTHRKPPYTSHRRATEIDNESWWWTAPGQNVEGNVLSTLAAATTASESGARRRLAVGAVVVNLQHVWVNRSSGRKNNNQPTNQPTTNQQKTTFANTH